MDQRQARKRRTWHQTRPKGAECNAHTDSPAPSSHLAFTYFIVMDV